MNKLISKTTGLFIVTLSFVGILGWLLIEQGNGSVPTELWIVISTMIAFWFGTATTETEPDVRPKPDVYVENSEELG